MTTNKTYEGPRGAHIAFWILQALLALAFLGAGMGKLFQPYDAVAAQMAWAREFPPVAVKLIGLAEVLGAFGLLLPSILRVLPILTPIAGAGLSVLMLGAVGTHVKLGEPPFAALVLAVLAAVVAYGRFKVARIQPRGEAPKAALA